MDSNSNISIWTWKLKISKVEYLEICLENFLYKTLLGFWTTGCPKKLAPVFAQFLWLQTCWKASSAVQKLIFTIAWCQDISKTIWGIVSQKVEIMNNQISWNLILLQFMHNCSTYQISHFQGDILRHALSSTPFL